SASAGAAGRPVSPATAPPGSGTPAGATPCSSSPSPRTTNKSGARPPFTGGDRLTRSPPRRGSLFMTALRSGLALGLAAAMPVVCGAWLPQHAGHKEGERAAGPSAKTLTVCAVPAAMPRTGKAPDGTPQGLDVAVAQLVGRSLGRKVEFHWC